MGLGKLVSARSYIENKLATAGKDYILRQYANELKKRNRKSIKNDGVPITEQELIEGLTDDWKSMGVFYRSRGITLDELIEAGKSALTDATEPEPEPKGFGIVYKAVEKIGRNTKCPCGSGKKYKHCCGR
ncbi:MAG: SEC-C metal-binding domain-containing protein [Dehalococcoidales bacterium]|nr:SEC-C metal-binding domain-containing protein [Dehalococcoidales bacterium]